MNLGQKKKSFLAIVGPTGSGKTAIAVELARHLVAAILSVDSMKVYRGMDIGTAKPRGEELNRIQWRGLDLVDANQTFTTASYIEYATVILGGASSPVILEGGTALYYKALVDGLFEGPAADWNLRGELQARAALTGSPALHDELKNFDPEAADRIHPQDLRRIVRALEVFKLTGKPITELQIEKTQASVDAEFHFIGIDRERDDLYERINQRTLKMFEEGLVQETKLILEKGGFSREASQALGYKEAFEHLEGKISFEECVDLVQRRTRGFSRRQRSWLKQFPGCEWNILRPGEENDFVQILIERFGKL